MEYFRKNLTKDDIHRAESMGIDIYGLMAGAHLGGVGNAIKAIRGQGNAKDMNNSSVLGYMKKFSQTSNNTPVLTDSKVMKMPPFEYTAPSVIPAQQTAVITENPIIQEPIAMGTIQEEPSIQQTIPEVVVTPKPRYYDDSQEILQQLSKLMTPYKTIELPKPLTATERLAQINENRNTLLQKDLENNIIRNSLLGNYDNNRLRRDVEDLQFYRNMSALGGNLFQTGGNKGREKVTNLSVWDELAAQSPLLYTIGKAVDPTGISGYGDAREAINQYGSAPSLNNGYTAVMETLGALPIVSKAGKAIKFLQGAITGQGIFNDYNFAQEKMKEYGDELVIDYWDNTVKPRWEAERHGEQMKSKMSYTDVHHVPSFRLAPKDSKLGQVISDYDINSRIVKKYKKAFGGNLFPKGGPMINVNPGDRVFTDQCALWSNSLLRDNGYLINGNAWNLGNVDLLYNGFEGLDRPENYDSRVIADYNHKAADNVFKNFDSKTLDTSKPYVVNMYYNNSPSQEEAYNNGKGVTGTHTGVLTFDPDTKRWLVTHNIHGNIHQEPFVSLQNGKGKYGVTAIYAPREKNMWNRVKGFFGFDNGGYINRV